MVSDASAPLLWARFYELGTHRPLFLGRDSARGDALLLSVKLPTSSIAALDRSECEPSGYGMGKHGWVTAKYERGDTLPIDLLLLGVTKPLPL